MPISTGQMGWSRLIRFIAPSGSIVLGEPTDPDVDVGLAIAEGTEVQAHVLDRELPWDSDLRRTGKIETVKQLLSPLSKEMTGTIRATGLSYKDHAAEMNLAFPPVPILFFKPPNAVADPNTTILIPKVAQNEEMDYEVELAIVIGKDAKNVSEEDALDYVLGYTCGNDLTARKHQVTTSQWGYGKGFDKFCPLGPCMVSTKTLPDPQIVSLQTTLNGKIMQDGTAREMIFPISRVVSYLSQGSTLPAGTVVITGTPPGIGDGRRPKVWLKDGDEVRCSISHGIGTLVNTIKYE